MLSSWIELPSVGNQGPKQHVEILKITRDRLVDDRRATAKVLAGAFEPAKSLRARRTIVELQTMIEAIDRATLPSVPDSPLKEDR